MKMRVLFGIVVFSGLASVSQAQPTHECNLPRPAVSQTHSGRPFTIRVCHPTVVVEDEIEKDNRIDGHYLRVDSGAEVLVSDMLPVGLPTLDTKKQLYSRTVSSGVGKGAHTAYVTPCNYPLDANGVPDKTKPPVRGTVIVIPFTAIDPILIGAPVSGTGWIIR